MATVKLEVLKGLDLRNVDSTHSNAEARRIINANFDKITEGLLVVASLDIDDLGKINFPDPPDPSQDYIFSWDGEEWNVVPSSTNWGNKYIIKKDENVLVAETYQYLIHDQLKVLGEIKVEGELVII